MELEPFSTRELAVGVWTLGFAAWAATFPAVRQSFWQVVRVALNWKLFVPFLAAAAYTVLSAWALKLVGLWTQDLLKDTILWFLFAGVALAFSGVQVNRELRWGAIAKDQLKVIVLVEYVVSTYTFSLAVEVLLVPVLVTVGLLNAVAGTDAKYSAVAKLTNGLQGLFGVAVLGFAIREAVEQWGRFAPAGALRSLLLSPLLSLLILPFVYVFALVAAYEQLFLKLTFGKEKDPQVVRYTKLKLLRHAGFRLRKVNDFARRHALDLIGLNSRADADRLVSMPAKVTEDEAS